MCVSDFSVNERESIRKKERAVGSMSKYGSHSSLSSHVGHKELSTCPKIESKSYVVFRRLVFFSNLFALWAFCGNLFALSSLFINVLTVVVFTLYAFTFCLR